MEEWSIVLFSYSRYLPMRRDKIIKKNNKNPFKFVKLNLILQARV